MKKSFRLSAILGLTTGKLLGKFSEMHELAEWVAGHPVWTHEFADKELNERLRQAILSEYPALAEASADNVTPDNYQKFVNEQIERFGGWLKITQGQSKRTEGPVESLRRPRQRRGKAMNLSNLPRELTVQPGATGPHVEARLRRSEDSNAKA